MAAIQGIGATVTQVSEIAGHIAEAVGQQELATREISSHVPQVAMGTRAVTASIGVVSGLAEQTGRAAGDVLDASGRLSRQPEEMRGEVSGFLAGVKAA